MSLIQANQPIDQLLAQENRDEEKNGADELHILNHSAFFKKVKVNP